VKDEEDDEEAAMLQRRRGQWEERRVRDENTKAWPHAWSLKLSLNSALREYSTSTTCI
jgi:hypothetical protein